MPALPKTTGPVPAPQRRQLGFGLGLHGNIFDNALVLLIMLGIAGFAGWTFYGDFRARSVVADGQRRAAQAQAAVEKAFAAKGPGDFSSTAYTGWSPPAPDAQVLSIAVARTGTITIRYSERVGGDGENQIQIVPVAEGKALDLSSPANAGRRFRWECGAGKSTVLAKHRGSCD